MTAIQSIRTETDWRAVLAAALCGIAVAMNVGKVPIALPQLRAEFGLSLVAAGWVSSMINTLAMVSGTFFGLLGDRFGALRMCFAGLALSIWSAYMPAGVGLAMLLAPAVMPLGGWRGIWLLTLAVLLVAALGIHQSRPAYRLPPHGDAEPHPLAAARQALAQPAPWLLAFAMGSWTIQHFALIVWLPTFLKKRRGFGALTVSILSCLMVLANVPGNLIGGRLLQKNYHRGNLIAGASLITGLCGVGVFLDLLPDLLRYALCVTLSFVGGLIPSAVLSASASLARTPKQVGTLQGLFMQVGNLGSFLSPPLIAAIVAASGLWRDALRVTASAALVGVVLGVMLSRLEGRVRR